MVDVKKVEDAAKADVQKAKDAVTGAVSAAKADGVAAQSWLSQHKAVVISALLALLVVVVAVWLA